ncbi:MAG: glycosyltransferase family 2 protein [Sphingomonadaceae bacterium]
MNPQASVVIPHYNDPSALDLCLTALEAQNFPLDRFEIIVADNASPCGIEAVRAVVGDRARLVEVLEPGAGPTRNGGAAVARGEYLAFTDSDCVPEPGWLAAGLGALEKADIVGGSMTVLVDRSRPLTAAEAFELVFAFDNRIYVQKKHFSVTANLFVRKADFERVGGFRTGVSEDQEWCLRARDMGLRIAYAAEAKVGHPARRSWPDFLNKWRRLVDEQYLITREWKFGRLRWLAKTWVLPLSILVHTPRVLKSGMLSGMNERLRAIAALVRIRLWRFIEAHRVLLRSRS